MGGLHGLLDDAEQLGAEGLQVHGGAGGLAEGGEGAGGVVVAAVEAPVDVGLDAGAQGRGGATHKQSYFDIVMVGIVSALVALVVVIVLGTMFGSF